VLKHVFIETQTFLKRKSNKNESVSEKWFVRSQNKMRK